MLVYANAFRLRAHVTSKDVLASIAKWLGASRREFPRVSADELATGGRIRFKSGSYVEVTTAEGLPALCSLRYHHPDNQVTGRDWFTEIGISHQEGSLPEVTVLVRTDEISSRVTAAITASRPGFVASLARADLLEPDTAGIDLKTLDDEYAAEGLRVSLDDPQRKSAYVIVSPDASGDYVVTPELLRAQLIGLAEVVQIPPGTVTYRISDILGKDFSAWGGAITIVLAPRADTGSRTIKLLPNQLAKLAEEGRRPEGVVLEAVAHRSNPILHARHISPGKVRDARQRRELKTRKEEAARTGDMGDYARLLEQDNEQLRGEKEALEERLLDEQVAREDDVRGLRYDNESLKHQMDHLANHRQEASAVEDGEQFRTSVFAAINGDATPEQALTLIERLFPDRIEVLPSAYKSAKDSREFQHRAKALELLRKLATDYFDTIAKGGKGDAQARKIFGNAYSATESESVENNRRAKEVRTFDHHGAPVEMMQHLRIGVKDSAAETLRIHFEWDPAEGKIIIGHCGPHLPFK